MQIAFSPFTTVIGGVLAALMIRASFWQAERHEQKVRMVAELQRNLQAPITEFSELAAAPPADWSSYHFRRVNVAGRYDFEHEVVLRNRRFEDLPGTHVITPLKVDGTDLHILVDRGFAPLHLSKRSERSALRREESAKFTGIIKPGVARRFLAPADPPTGGGRPWVDQWLRVDIAQIAEQLPYSLAPVYLEIMENPSSAEAAALIVSAKNGRDDIFFPGSEVRIPSRRDVPELAYPVPMFDTVVPPSRHKGYVYEWAFMALGTVLITVVLQLKRNGIPRDSTVKSAGA